MPSSFGAPTSHPHVLFHILTCRFPRVHLYILIPLAVRFSSQVASRYYINNLTELVPFVFRATDLRYITADGVPNFTFNLQFHRNHSVAWSLQCQYSVLATYNSYSIIRTILVEVVQLLSSTNLSWPTSSPLCLVYLYVLHVLF